MDGWKRRRPPQLGSAGSAVRRCGSGCHVIITEGKTAIDAATLRDLHDLVAVVRCGVEVRHIDVDAASAEGILVVNTPVPEHVTPVAELTIGFMVCLAKDVVNRTQGLRASQPPWSPMGMQLRGHVLGAVGFGAIGQEVARVAQAMGMRVCFTDPNVGPTALAEKMEFTDLLAEADVISLHARWTRETEGMFGEAEFRRMKPSAYFINTARCALVDERALERALREGWIAGAALDVFGNEPEIVSNALLALPNVIATPHIAGYSLEAVSAQAWRTVDIVKILQAGDIPVSSVNRSAIARPRLVSPAAEARGTRVAGGSA